MNKKQKEYKELRKLGYCKATVRRAIHGDISHTVRFVEDRISSPFYRDSVGTEELPCPGK